MQIDQKKNQSATSSTFFFIGGFKNMALHTYVVAGRWIMENVSHIIGKIIWSSFQRYMLHLSTWNIQITEFENISMYILENQAAQYVIGSTVWAIIQRPATTYVCSNQILKLE